MKKLILTLSIFLFPLSVFAINITVPSAPGLGYWLTSSTTGAYQASSTNSILVGSVNATSTNATSTFSGNFVLSSLGAIAGTFLAADPNGKIIATTTPSGTPSQWTTLGNNIYNNNTGGVSIGTSTPPIANFQVAASTTPGVPFIITGVTGQTSKVMQVLKSDGTELAHIDPYMAANANNSLFSVTSATDFNTSVPPYMFGSFFSIKNANGVKVVDVHKDTGAGGDINFTVSNSAGTNSFTFSNGSGVLGFVKDASVNIFRIAGTNIINFENKMSTGSFNQDGIAEFTDSPVNGSTVGQIIYANTTQTSDLLQMRDATNGTLDEFTGKGLLGVGSSTPWGQLSASSTSSFPTLAIEQKGSGPAAAFLGGNVGIATTTPNSKLTVYGDVEISDVTKGIVMHDTVTGTCYRVTIAAGVLTPASITCP